MQPSDHEAAESAPGKPSAAGPREGVLLLLIFPLLALLLLWDALVGGRVFLPAVWLQGFAPWNVALSPEARQALPQWNALQWDGMAEFYPWRLFAARELQAGRIPLWNPHVLAGTPFLANSQSAPLYPFHALYALPLGASVAVRMAWLDLVHLSLAGSFAYLLARDLKARPGAALLGGAAYELSGFAVAWLELPSFITVGCWIPLLLLLLGRALRAGSWRTALGAGAAAGMMLLGGHLQIAFYGLLAAGLTAAGSGQWAVGSGQSAAPSTINHQPSTRTTPIHFLALLVLVLGIGFALAGPQVLSSVELSRMSHRAGRPTQQGYDGYVALALSPRNWVNLLVPDYFGLPGRNDFWGLSRYGAPEVMEYAGSVGAAAFVFVVAGLVWGWRVDRRAGLMALLGAVALLLATGSPLCRLFYFYVPGFAQSGSPARALVLLCLSQAMLAALGLEWTLRRVEHRWTDVVLPLGAGLAVTLTLTLLLHGLALANLPSQVEGVRAALEGVALPALSRTLGWAAAAVFLLLLLAWLLRENRASHRQGAVGGAALVVVSGGLLLLGGAYNPTARPGSVYPDTPLTRALRALDGRVVTLNRRWSLAQVPDALLPPNSSLAGGWRDAQGYDSLYLGNYRRLAEVINGPEGASPPENGNMLFFKRADSPLFPLLSARYVVGGRGTEARVQGSGFRGNQGSGFGVQGSGVQPANPVLYEDPAALPEARTVGAWIVAEDLPGLQALAESPARLRTTALLAPGSAVPSPAGSLAARPAPGLALERPAPGRMRVRVPAEHGALLIVAEGYAPGWKATLHVPGQPPRPAPVLRTNVAFQGLFLPPGPVTVELRFAPASFRVGLFFALAALALLLGGACPRRARLPERYAPAIPQR